MMNRNLRLPVLFISHGGGPWPFIDAMKPLYAETRRQLEELPSRLPGTPKAILVATAHWEEAQFTVSSGAHPPMLYDYYGFPAHTYQVRYPAPGSPDLAKRAGALLDAAGIGHREDPGRGFDHGTFVPLSLMFPDAVVPVVMLSLKSTYDAAEHVRMGAALEPLRDEGVLIVGSGLTYHNMRGFGHDAATTVADVFEGYLNAAISAPDAAQRNDALVHWQSAPGARLAHPQEDHLLPLMVAAGAAGADVGRRVFVDRVMKVAMGTYVFGDLRDAREYRPQGLVDRVG